jgi:hypothetical protein
VCAGRHEENRQGAIRHAHNVIAHGGDDAMALSLGGFSILVEHDRAAARKVTGNWRNLPATFAINS